jgi:hypothetical protein
MRLYTPLILGTAALLIAGLPLAAQTAAAPPPAGAPHGQMHHAMPKPTNLQVLPKDISDKQLIGVMRGFTHSLGVECSFCHEEDPALHRMNFASDAKPQKSTARTMMRMTHEINTKYLSTVNDPDASPEQKSVTCGTCHRGHSMPEPFVAANKGEGHPPMPPKP